jgi:hypothetical protein
MCLLTLAILKQCANLTEVCEPSNYRDVDLSSSRKESTCPLVSSVVSADPCPFSPHIPIPSTTCPTSRRLDSVISNVMFSLSVPKWTITGLWIVASFEFWWTWNYIKKKWVNKYIIYLLILSKHVFHTISEHVSIPWYAFQGLLRELFQLKGGTNGNVLPCICV